MCGTTSFLGPVTGIGCVSGGGGSGNGLGDLLLGIQALNDSMSLGIENGSANIKILNRLQHQRLLQLIKKCTTRTGRRFRGRLLTWNSLGTLGKLGLTNPEQAKLKHAALRRCLNDADIIHIQETHATPGEIQILLEELHGTFHCIHGCADSRMRGGVAIFIRIAWCQQFKYIWGTVVKQGRAVSFCAVDEDGSVSSHNLHIPPQWSISEKRGIIDAIFEASPSSECCLNFVGGDLNFSCASPEAGTSAEEHEAQCHARDPAYRYFMQKLSRLTELHQPLPTHKFCGLSGNRLDRWWTDMPTVDIITHKPHTYVLWNEISHLGRASDHYPVLSAFFNAGRQRLKLPNWIPLEPDFQSVCCKFAGEMCNPYSNKIDRLGYWKEIFRMATQELTSYAKAGSAVAPEHRLYWALLLYRHGGDVDGQMRRAACRADPSLLSFYVDKLYIKWDALHQHITDLNIQVTQAKIDHAVSSENPDERNKVAHLSKWLSLWTRKTRLYQKICILGEDGQVCSSDAEGASALRNHWRPTFSDPGKSVTLAAKFLKRFVQQVPIGIDWILDFETFAKMLLAAGDSAPGPDGVSYKFWQFAPIGATRALYDVYLDLMSEGGGDCKFNDSFMTFIPKGKEDGDDRHNICREPKNTRPLTLSNTDNKYCAQAAASPLNHVAAQTISSEQRGGVKGRQMVDNPLDIECKALQFAIQNCKEAGIVAFDVRAAFPSISRPYLFWVLKMMGVPRRIRRIIYKLYSGCKCYIVISGTVHEGFELFSGVKQGCPLSMVLFALALDPLIRYMCSRIDPRDCFRAFCDDLAIAAINVRATLHKLAGAFYIAERSCNLGLNKAKIQCLALDEDFAEILKTELNAQLQFYDGMRIVQAILYLGVQLGPGAFEVQWNKTLKGMTEACLNVNTLGLGWFASLPLFNALVTSRGAWLASIAPLSPQVLDHECWLIQKVLTAPWQAIPSKFVQNLKAAGGSPIEVASLETIAIAGKCRNALHTSTVYHQCLREVRETLEGDSRVLKPKLWDWLQNSIIYGWRDAVEICQNICRPILVKFPEKTLGFQKLIYCKLREEYEHENLQKLLFRRWDEKIPDALQRHAITEELSIFWPELLKLFKPCIAAAVLRVWLNGLCTSARFQKDVLDCPFCGREESDSAEHILRCPRALEAAMQFWICSVPLSCSLMFARGSFGAKILNRKYCNIMAIHDYAISKWYNITKATGMFLPSTYEAIIVKLARDCSSTRRVLTESRSSCDSE